VAGGQGLAVAGVGLARDAGRQGDVGADLPGTLDGGPAADSEDGSYGIPAAALFAQGAQNGVALVRPHELVSHSEFSGGFGPEDRHIH
jgi:hypothetical protein